MIKFLRNIRLKCICRTSIHPSNGDSLFALFHSPFLKGEFQSPFMKGISNWGWIKGEATLRRVSKIDFFSKRMKLFSIGYLQWTIQFEDRWKPVERTIFTFDLVTVRWHHHHCDKTNRCSYRNRHDTVALTDLWHIYR